MNHDREHEVVEPGSLIAGRYRVRREIARGATGVVLEASHETLLKTRAVKVLTEAAHGWATGGRRLVREGRVLARSNHPNIVGVHDAGTCERHGPFLALEMIDGRSLESYLLARQTLDLVTTAHVGTQLAGALARVHSLGFVHRDVKPSNVVLARDPGADSHSVKLIDFGLACPVGVTTDEKLTVSGEVLGTVHYMAPELLVHEAPASAASDVYALGVLLYECLVGELPFAGGPINVITAHVSRQRPAGLETRRSDLPRSLVDVIMKALEADPTARASSVEELGTACRAVLGADRSRLEMDAASTPPSVGARRQHVRAPFSAPARLLRAQTMEDGRTEDISEGGALVVVAAECNPGEQVSLRFPLPGTGRITTVRGAITWVKAQRGQCAVGVRFVDVAEEARKAIALYVEIMTRGVPQACDAETPGGVPGVDAGPDRR